MLGKISSPDGFQALKEAAQGKSSPVLKAFKQCVDAAFKDKV